MENKVINLNYITELSKGDTKFIEEMIAIFLSENPEEVKQLEEAIHKGNFDQIRSVSHHMKSTIPFMGLDLIIGNELLEIENLAAKKNNIEKIKNNFLILKKVCEKAVEELKN